MMIKAMPLRYLLFLVIYFVTIFVAIFVFYYCLQLLTFFFLALHTESVILPDSTTTRKASSVASLLGNVRS